MAFDHSHHVGHYFDYRCYFFGAVISCASYYRDDGGDPDDQAVSGLAELTV